MNPFRKFRATIKKKFGGKSKGGSDEPAVDYRELRVLWPDGTWQKKVGSASFAEMDKCVRGVIYDTWANEEFLTAQALADHELNPGMFGGMADSIPAGWKPSEKVLKMLFARNRWNVDYMHYIVGEMESMNNIRP